MSQFDQSRSVFAGMSQAALTTALQSAQAALIALQTGAQVQTVSYGMGGEQRSVTYRRNDTGGLVQLIGELKACLGLVRHARRGFRFSY